MGRKGKKVTYTKIDLETNCGDEPILSKPPRVLVLETQVDGQDAAEGIEHIIVSQANRQLKGEFQRLMRMDGVVLVCVPSFAANQTKAVHKAFQHSFANGLMRVPESNVLLLGTWHSSTYIGNTKDWAWNHQGRHGQGLVVIVSNLESMEDLIDGAEVGDATMLMQLAPVLTEEGVTDFFMKTQRFLAVMFVWPQCMMEALLGNTMKPKPLEYRVLVDSVVKALGAGQADIPLALQDLARDAAERCNQDENRRLAEVEQHAAQDSAESLRDESVGTFAARHPPPAQSADICWRFEPKNLKESSSWLFAGRVALGEKIAKSLLGAQKEGFIAGQWRREAPSEEHALNEWNRAKECGEEGWMQESEKRYERAKIWKKWELEGDQYMQEIAWQIWDICVAAAAEAELPAVDILNLVDSKQRRHGGSRAYRAVNHVSPAEDGPRIGDLLVALGLRREMLNRISLEELPYALKGQHVVEDDALELQGDVSEIVTWYLFDENALKVLEQVAGEKVLLKYLAKPGHWGDLEVEQHALTQVGEIHRRAQSGFAKATNWTGVLNLVGDLVGLRHTHDGSDELSWPPEEWTSQYGQLLPSRVQVHYGRGRVFGEDKQQKTKMEANVLEAAVGELLASGRDDCCALADLISGLCTVSTLYPPINIPPSNRYMLVEYESKTSHPLPGHKHFDVRKFDQWIEERLAKIPAEVPADGHQPTVPNEESVYDALEPPAKWGNASFYERQAGGLWRCKLCHKVCDDNHVETAKHKWYAALPENDLEDWLGPNFTPVVRAENFTMPPVSRRVPAEDVPPQEWGRKDLYKKKDDGSWFCRLCSKVCDDAHVESKGHKKNLLYDEKVIQVYLDQCP